MDRPYLIAGIILVFFLSFFLFQQINLTTADIGRHIINGKLFLNTNQFDISSSALLDTNFFSLIYPDFPFINHHWGSGILVYLIFILFGFKGLSVVYGGLIILATFILFYIWKNKLSVWVSFPVVLFLLPLIAERTEVRPEGLSYFFMALVIALLHLYTTDRIQKKWLWLIPIVSLIWVNTHIYFIFVPFFVGLFMVQNFINKEFQKTKKLAIILITSLTAFLINPYGLTGVLYPFKMFQNYGYLIVENQSIPFLTNLHINNPNFLWWKIATAIFVISSIYVFWKKRKKFPIALFGITTTFAVLSFLGIRHLAPYGLVLIPNLLCYGQLIYRKPDDERESYIHLVFSVILSAIILASIFIQFNSRLPWNSHWGIGLQPGVNASADFVKTLNLSGPIFSNYDIGGYLIFHMYPKEKVFVDNRPEAYPVSFFKEVYIPMQESESVWKKELDRWNFNMIWFYRNDLTPWAQQFLISKISDSEWAPIFVDNYTIIFLRRNQKNAKIIKQYELPKDIFMVGQP